MAEWKLYDRCNPPEQNQKVIYYYDWIGMWRGEHFVEDEFPDMPSFGGVGNGQDLESLNPLIIEE